MTDTSNIQNANENAPQNSTQIGIGIQYVKDLSFENPMAPHIFTETSQTPQHEVGVNVGCVQLKDDAFEVVLTITLTAKMEQKTAYIAELAYAGVFVIPASMPDDAKKMFLMTEAPRLLFPFVRSLIATVVREGGYNPVLLNPIDFVSMFLSNQNNVGMMQPAGAA